VRSEQSQSSKPLMPIAAGVALVLLMAGPAGSVFALDNSASETTPAVSDDISEPEGPAWDRVEEPSDDSNGQVLEIAPAVNAESADSEGWSPADDQAADANDQAADQTANDPSDEIGDVSQYDDGSDNVPSAVPLWPRPPVVLGFPRSRLGPLGYSKPYPGAVVARPNGLLAIPPTSPMLTMPRGSFPMVGGWWARAR
jgi:hypothetical protein